MNASMAEAGGHPAGQTGERRGAKGQAMVAPVKWFDVVKGYGFLAPEDGGDILIHYNLLHPLGRKSVPEGAMVSVLVEQGPRGRQAVAIVDIDLSTAAPAAADAPRGARPRRNGNGSGNGRDLLDAAGEFVPARVRWFNRTRGYGFLDVEDDDQQAFLHVETLHRAGIEQVEPGARIAARIAHGPRGLLAVEVRASAPTLD